MKTEKLKSHPYKSLDSQQVKYGQQEEVQHASISGITTIATQTIKELTSNTSESSPSWAKKIDFSTYVTILKIEHEGPCSDI